MPEELTLSEAKTVSLEVLRQLVAYVPADAVEEDYGESTEMYLLSCDAAGKYRWPGSNQIRVTDGTDIRSIVEQIEADWSAKPGWEVGWQTTPGGAEYLSLDSPDGYHFSVGGTSHDTVFDAASFSPCFPMGDDYSPHKKY